MAVAPFGDSAQSPRYTQHIPPNRDRIDHSAENRTPESVDQTGATAATQTTHSAPLNQQATAQPETSSNTQPKLPSKKDHPHLDVTPEKNASVAATRDWIIRALKCDTDTASGNVSEKFLYVENQEAFDQLLSEVTVESGKPKNKPGPLKALLQQPATLILNEAGFTDAQLEALNEIKMERRYKGESIHKNFRVISIIDADKKSLGARSPALISRAHYLKIPQNQLVEPPPLKANEARFHEVAAVIDCTTSDWQHLFSSSLERLPPKAQSEKNAEQGNWRLQASRMAQSFEAKQPVVIRNAPLQNFHFQTELRQWQEKFEQAGLTISLETGISQTELDAALKNKSPAKGLSFGQTQQGILPTKNIWTVNQSNADTFVDKGQFRVENGPDGRDGEVLPLEPILAQAQSATSAEPVPILLVTENLDVGQWHNLMRSNYEFQIAAADSVSVPDAYRDHVASYMPASKVDTIFYPDQLSSALNQSVTLLSSSDPSLTLQTLKQQPNAPELSHFYVTPDMHLGHLAQSVEFSVDDDKGVTGKTKLAQLVKDLQQGKNVVIHGLNNNSGLQKSLATLLNPPHYLYLNGERYNLNNGQGAQWDADSATSAHNNLTGKIIILSDDATFFDQYSGVAKVQDNTIDTSSRRKTLKQALASAGHDQPHINQLIDTIQAFERSGLLKSTDRSFTFARLASLLTTVKDLKGPHSREAHQLLKDRLTGDFRHNPEQYAKAKVIFKCQWGKAGTPGVDPNSARTVNTEKLQALIASQGFRSSRVTSVSPNLWQCLNCFSPAVLKGLGDSGRLSNNKIANFINQHLDAHAQGLPTDIASRAVSKADQASDHRIQKLDGKINQAFQSSRAVFLKSAAGLGKTHAIKRISETLQPGAVQPLEPITIDVSQVTGSALHEAIERWATSDGKALLVIDEANLAPKESLALLKEVFLSGSVTVNGQRHQLNADHKMLFTGNYDSFAGRTVQEVAHDAFNTITLKPFSHAYLGEQFVAPVIEKAVESGALPKAFATTELQDTLIEIHEKMAQTFPSEAFSVRNLEEFLAHAVVQLGQTHSQDQSADVAARLRTAVADVYLQGLSTLTRETAERWIEQNILTRLGAIDVPTSSGSAQTAPFKLAATDSIVPTASTQKLAEGLNRWLDTQCQKATFNPKSITLGQRGFLIEGPAGRGKDQVVSAVLVQREWPAEKTTTLNAGSDLEGFSEAVKHAAKNGHVLVISELNLFPSHIIEGELNHLLTGNADVHPDFSLIATVNPPSYTGRKPLSPAILNRMVVNRIEEYPEQECIEIAQSIAQKTYDALPKNLQPVVKPARSEIAKLAQAHHDLVVATTAADRATPTTRQLRRAVVDSVHQPRTVENILASHYAYYQEELQSASTTRAPKSRADEAGQIIQALSLITQLEKPEWPSLPTFITTQHAANPIEYNAKTHQVKVNFSHPALRGQDPADFLSVRLLAQISGDSLPIDGGADSNTSSTATTLDGRLADIEPVTKKKNKALAPFKAGEATQVKSKSRKTLFRRLGNAIAKMRTQRSNVLRFQRLADVFRTAPSARVGNSIDDPLTISPTRGGTSGVGSTAQGGTFGTITANDALCRTGVESLTGERIGFNNLVAAVGGNGDKTVVSQVVLENKSKSDITQELRPRRIYLPQLKDTVPSDVIQLKDQQGGTHELPVVKREGGWCVENCPPNQTLTYTLYAAKPENTAPECTFSEKRKVIRLSPETNQPLHSLVLDLKQQYKAGDIDAAEVVESLDAFFKDTNNFVYSRDCVSDYAKCKTIDDRCNQFLQGRRGVCYEYAHTFGRILEQEFAIPCRMVDGKRVTDHALGREGHQWLDYWHPQAGQWFEADPTGSPPPPPEKPAGPKPLPFNGLRKTPIQTLDDEFYPPAAVIERLRGELDAQQNSHVQESNLPPHHDDPQFIERLTARLSALGLFQSDEVATQQYTSENRGKMDVKRALKGETDCFKIRGIKNTPKPKGLYIYHAVDSRKWQYAGFETSIPVPLMPAINQLLQMGVPIYVMDARGAKPITDAKDLIRLPKQKRVQMVGSPELAQSLEKDIHLKKRSDTEDFFKKLGKIYFQTLAEAESQARPVSGASWLGEPAAESLADRSTLQAILTASLNASAYATDLLPIQVPVGEEVVALTPEKYDLLTLEPSPDVSKEDPRNINLDQVCSNPSHPDNQHRICQYTMALSVEEPNDAAIFKRIALRSAAEAVIDAATIRSLKHLVGQLVQSIDDYAALDYINSGGRSSLTQISQLYGYIQAHRGAFADEVKSAIEARLNNERQNLTQLQIVALIKTPGVPRSVRNILVTGQRDDLRQPEIESSPFEPYNFIDYYPPEDLDDDSDDRSYTVEL